MNENKESGETRIDIRKVFRDKNLENYSFHQWTYPTDISTLLTELVEDIVVNMPRVTPYIPIGFDLKTVEDIAKKQGFEVNEKHEVLFT